MTTVDDDWWHPAKGFFGKGCYMAGDDSIEGYLPGRKEPLIARTKREVNGLVSLLNLPLDARILDIPCGYGRHSKLLDKMGYSVLGIDINPEHLSEARNSSAKFILGDMRDIPVKSNYFDAVANMTLSFGFFEDDDNLLTIAEFYRVLKEGGQLVIHSDASPEMIEQGSKYQLHEKRTLLSGQNLIIDEYYDSSSQRLNGSWTIGNQCKYYSVRIYSRTELIMLAETSGFGKARVYGSFDKDGFCPDSSEIILHAVK